MSDLRFNQKISPAELATAIDNMSSQPNMFIVKRDGRKEEISFDKITRRVTSLCDGLNMSFIDPLRIVKSVIEGLFSGAKTSQLDTLAAEICASLSNVHHDYNTLAARIEISNLHKETSDSFVETVRKLYNCERDGERCPMVTKEFLDDVEFHGAALDAAIDYTRDYDYGYFAIKTLQKSYLLKFDGHIIERPQHMLMRVAVALHGRDLGAAIETYDAMSQRKFIHASPTLFNAGCPRNGLASCFLIHTPDSIEGIFDAIKECAMVSALSGGIGINISEIRSKGSLIKSTGGHSEGIIPLLKVLNDTALFVTQSSKRPGAIACFIEPHHPEVLEFLDMKRLNGKDDMRARDLFYALWVSDLFMEKVEKDEDWCLFCPGECPGLATAYGDDYRKLYAKYEAEGKYRKKIKARDAWDGIIKSQIESGTPYILFKDRVNLQNNQAHIGTIRNSNLCVAPETKILTKNGHMEISLLCDKEVELWNGEEWSKAIVRKTSDASELIKVSFSNGAFIECTPYHKFHVAQFDKHNGYRGSIVKEAKDLTIDDKLIKVDFPVIQGGTSTMKYPYAAGLFSADGTYATKSKGVDEVRECSYARMDGSDFCFYHRSSQGVLQSNTDKCKGYIVSKKPKIELYKDKKELVEHLPARIVRTGTNDTIAVELPFDMPPKFSVPMGCDLDTRLRWLEGYCDGDGCAMLCEETSSYTIQMSSIEFDFLDNVRLMLQTMGIDAKLQVVHKARKTILPNGLGGKAEYDCSACYRLLLTGVHVHQLYELGFRPKRLDLTGIQRPKKECRRYVKVTAIEETGRVDETYCFTEPLKNRGVFNGVIAGNCSEITLYCDEKETAVCILASACLPSYVTKRPDGTMFFDHEELARNVRIMTRNLNKVIDKTKYPNEKTIRSNMRHRPIAIGVSGLQDAFLKLKIAFDSSEARQLNNDIAETIYYAAVSESCELAKTFGPYETFTGSEFSKGRLQFDLARINSGRTAKFSGRYDWDALRREVIQHGTRNCLLTGYMPTASTSTLLGVSEAFEPLHGVIYMRRTMSGEFQMVNKYLVNDLVEAGLWNETTKNLIIQHRGSVQNINVIPDDIKRRYKTVWNLSQKVIIDMAADRQMFTDQTQSMNLFKAQPTYSTISSMLMYGWKQGLKTGLYYLRSQPRVAALQFTQTKIVQEPAKTEPKRNEESGPVCRMEEGCVSCSG
ncbi:hypothetical protein GGF31_003428 [Allomyces arbusculus]|nr:hypothetical protein GGF31_003428 [Allomyces arbusculus]